MIIGTTKELKNHEYRVGLTPDCVSALKAHGHEIYVDTTAVIGWGDKCYFFLDNVPYALEQAV